MVGSKTVLLGTGVWLLAAYLAGASGLMRVVRPPLPQVLIVALTAALLVFFCAPSIFRRWALSVDLRALLQLPLSLLPTFLVPLIIATHVIIFARLRRLIG